jgi:hypothetical protein
MTIRVPLRRWYIQVHATLTAHSLEVLRPFSAKHTESTILGFTSPDSFHLQAFSTSWWFTPRYALWPCFMPLALLGFTRGASPWMQLRTLIGIGGHTLCMSCLHLHPPAWLQANSQTLHTRRYVRPNKHADCTVCATPGSVLFLLWCYPQQEAVTPWVGAS